MADEYKRQKKEFDKHVAELKNWMNRLKHIVKQAKRDLNAYKNVKGPDYLLESIKKIREVENECIGLIEKMEIFKQIRVPMKKPKKLPEKIPEVHNP